MKFLIEKKEDSGKARAGIIESGRGKIETPIFMPVGTLGSVKGLHQKELDEVVKAPVILGNSYHLYLRPGLDVLEKLGGLHQFIGWKNHILTDSGGYQVYSLAHNRKISDEGVRFQSHIDGSKHFIRPEDAMDIQRSIGADIMMAFDECTPYPCDYAYAKTSLKLTHQWLIRSIKRFNETKEKYGFKQSLFPIVQGSTYSDLRKESARFIADQGAEGNAIGGLSVGEPHEMMYEMTEEVCEILPSDKPRYLMGVGTPVNILESIDRGIDMFDCVMPTRNARHGLLYTSEGIINIKNEKWKYADIPINPEPLSFIDEYYSRAYLRHLVHNQELLGAQIASINNLVFYLWLVRKAREQILNGNFTNWKSEMIEKLNRRL